MAPAAPDRPAIEPSEALLPFRPGTDGPWDRAAAAHLVRRAGFGMPEALVKAAEALGPRAAAEDLLRPKPEAEEVRFTSAAARKLGSEDAARSSWAYRMVRGANPSVEKLALFWHGHFATSNRKVENARLMMRQIDLFRELGAGPYGDLLLGVARDPAMLVWLDGNSNRRGKPNENFAREILELFALGIGNYTEDDIKEAARAFTGWHVKDDEFWFNERAHDRGVKRIFGESGPFGGEEVVRLAAAREACAGFLAAKLFEFYVHPAPAPALRQELGRAYAACGKRTGEYLVRLLSSRVFHSPRARRALVATPADFAVGSLRTLGATAGAGAVVKAMAAMGQDLLRPPSVKGWDMGQAWLSSGTLLARYRFAQGIARGPRAEPELQAEVPWERIGPAGRGVIERFFPDGLEPGVEKELLELAAGDVRTLASGCLELPEGQFV